MDKISYKVLGLGLPLRPRDFRDPDHSVPRAATYIVIMLLTSLSILAYFGYLLSNPATITTLYSASEMTPDFLHELADKKTGVNCLVRFPDTLKDEDKGIYFRNTIGGLLDESFPDDDDRAQITINPWVTEITCQKRMDSLADAHVDPNDRVNLTKVEINKLKKFCTIAFGSVHTLVSKVFLAKPPFMGKVPTQTQFLTQMFSQHQQACIDFWTTSYARLIHSNIIAPPGESDPFQQEFLETVRLSAGMCMHSTSDRQNGNAEEQLFVVSGLDEEAENDGAAGMPNGRRSLKNSGPPTGRNGESFASIAEMEKLLYDIYFELSLNYTDPTCSVTSDQTSFSLAIQAASLWPAIMGGLVILGRLVYFSLKEQSFSLNDGEALIESKANSVTVSPAAAEAGT